MKEIRFNKEQLFTIEKMFDEIAHNTQRAFADTVEKMSKVKGSEKYIHKLMDESVRAYDLCRTISAICSQVRK